MLEIVYWRAPAVGERVTLPPKGCAAQVLVVLEPIDPWRWHDALPKAWNPLGGMLGYRAVVFGRRAMNCPLLYEIGMPHSDMLPWPSSDGLPLTVKPLPSLWGHWGDQGFYNPLAPDGGRE